MCHDKGLGDSEMEGHFLSPVRRANKNVDSDHSVWYV
jgi:hypothetical protein